MKYRIGVVALVAMLAVFYGQVADSQITQPGKKNVPKKVKPNKKKPPGPAIQFKPIRITPKLKQVLGGKKRFKPNLLQAKLRYRNKIPLLKLAGNREIALQPISKIEVKPNKKLLRAAAKLDPKLKKYRKYIKQEWIVAVKPEISVIQLAVDHRSRQTPIRNQAGRNTCVAFAAAAGIESFYRWKNNAVRDLSEQHAFKVFMDVEGRDACQNQGLNTWRAAGYLTNNRICTESAAPYSTAVPPCGQGVPAGCQSNRNHGHLTTQVFFGTNYGGEGVMNANNTNYLESVLNEGFDIVYGVAVAGTDWSDDTLDDGVVDVQVDANGQPAGAFGGHAMLLVGYHRVNNYFIFKNSWGSQSGHNGYVYLSYEYVQTYGKYGYYIKTATNP